MVNELTGVESGMWEYKQQLTYGDLLNCLTDMRRLALPVDREEQGGCMSSYDRASRYDGEQDRYIAWGANADGSGCIETLPNGDIVAFDCDGPGVVWRVWSALPQQGHLRIYFDGEKEPTVDIPFVDWFEKEPNCIPPLNYSELSMRLSRGRVTFIPIPFQKHCRIVLSKGWGSYYHFTYSRYSADVCMPSFSCRYSREGLISLAKTDRVLYARGEEERNEQMVRRRIPSGTTTTLLRREGDGAIEQITLLTDAQPKLNTALKQLILRIYWDGQAHPSVEAPLGAFFGGAGGYAHYRTLPMSMERGGCVCRFYMPFFSDCKVTLTNPSTEPITVRMAFAVQERCEAAQTLLRFHAKWHAGYWGELEQKRFQPGADRWPDWPVLLVRNASGRFCGMHMYIRNTWKQPHSNAEQWWYGQWDQKTVDWWWGEGDEKFFVDGEAFPSTFGTGSEDYIGYAWAAEPPFALFDSPFAYMSAMPLDGNGNTSVGRFQIADNVPFHTSFEGFIEKYKEDCWDSQNTCQYAVVPYWYQQAGTADDYPSGVEAIYNSKF